MTSKQVTSPPWNSRRLVHSKEMAWASRWSVALRAFYKQILSSSNCKDFFFKWHRPPRKLAKEVFVKFIPAKEKTRFAKEWRKVLAKDHVIRIDSHEVFNTAHLMFFPLAGTRLIACDTCLKLNLMRSTFLVIRHLKVAMTLRFTPIQEQKDIVLKMPIH